MKNLKYLALGTFVIVFMLYVWFSQFNNISYNISLQRVPTPTESGSQMSKEIVTKKSNTKTKAVVTKNDVQKTTPKLTITTQNTLNIPNFKNAQEAEEYYYKTITINDWQCKSSKRIGRSDDGGWDVCFDGKLAMKQNDCLSYSFGVNYIWEFDDIVARDYKCTVRTFDPSMANEPAELKRESGVMFYKLGLGKSDTTWSNGWKIMKMSSFLNKFQESDKLIDILKIDIEFSEWDAFESMIQDGVLKKVKQLLFETHTDNVQGRASTLESFKRFLTVWNKLKELGFVQWKNHWNHFGNYNSPFSGTQRTCCFEHYMVNKNLL